MTPQDLSPQTIDNLITGFFVLVFLIPVGVGILKFIDPSAFPRPRTVIYEFRQRRNRLRDAALMRNLHDPATFTLYDSVYYPEDRT